MIKALVTGGNGQLAQSLKDVVNHQDELDVDFQDLPDLDITNKQQLESYFSNNELDYCLICDQLNYNKYLINHCKLCNKCHVKNKLHCIYCKQCYNINFNNDNDIIRHKKQCIDFKRFSSY